MNGGVRIRDGSGEHYCGERRWEGQVGRAGGKGR